jgi:hypothetical protein
VTPKKSKKKKEGKKNSLLLHKNHQSAFVRLCVQSRESKSKIIKRRC